ncbi:hypothetical protein SPRG_16556, partial [Saprolegnia parasitica CBS 223.65]
MLRGAAGLAFAMGAATASFRSGTYICDTWNAWNCFPTVPTIVRWSDNGIDVECMSTDGKTCLPTTTPDACIQLKRQPPTYTSNIKCPASLPKDHSFDCDSAANAAALRYAGADHQCAESIYSVDVRDNDWAQAVDTDVVRDAPTRHQRPKTDDKQSVDSDAVWHGARGNRHSKDDDRDTKFYYKRAQDNDVNAVQYTNECAEAHHGIAKGNHGSSKVDDEELLRNASPHHDGPKDYHCGTKGNHGDTSAIDPNASSHDGYPQAVDPRPVQYADPCDRCRETLEFETVNPGSVWHYGSSQDLKSVSSSNNGRVKADDSASEALDPSSVWYARVGDERTEVNVSASQGHD